MNTKYSLIVILLVFSTIFSSCKKKDDPVPETTYNYTVPTVYNFSNVDHKDATAVINAMTAVDNLTKTGTTTNVDAATLKSMYKGQTGPVNLENLTWSYGAKSLIESYFDSIAIASQSYTNSSPSSGVAGVGSYTSTTTVNGVTTTKTSYYLLSGRGINYQQLISKAMFGTILYNQITQKLSEQSIGNSVDNNTVYADEGTLMEHHWDEAFGYYGVPDSFPTVITGLKYLGSYSNQVNGGTGANAILMNAFLKGRAAISGKDMATKQAQADIITSEFELMLAAAAIHEINGITGVTSKARINTLLSESMGLLIGLKYSPRKKITNAQIDKILTYYGNNLYDVTQTNLDNIVSELSSIYGFANPSTI
jgi:hypothetical protein